MPLSDIVENADIARIPNGGDNMSNSNNNNNCNCGCIPSDKQCPPGYSIPGCPPPPCPPCPPYPDYPYPCPPVNKAPMHQ